MDALRLLLAISDPEEFRALRENLGAGAAPQHGPGDYPAGTARSATVRPGHRRSCHRFPPPDARENLLGSLDLGEVWTYLNEQMLYGKHLGLREFPAPRSGRPESGRSWRPSSRIFRDGMGSGESPLPGSNEAYSEGKPPAPC